MRRRGFDHLFAELSVAVGRRLPRWDLWLRLRELDLDPDRLSRADAIRFCDAHLESYLGERGLRLSERGVRRLRRAVGRCDPRHPTPAEVMARLTGGPR